MKQSCLSRPGAAETPSQLFTDPSDTPMGVVDDSLKGLAEKAVRIRATLLGDESLSKYVRHCIIRNITLFSSSLNSVLVDKARGLREEDCIHRSLLVGMILATFCGKPSPEIDTKLLSEIRRYKKLAAVDSTENWGPVLVVCKFEDIDTWEAGLNALLKDFQLETMAYYGSDSDRIALRSYLRALAPAGGLHSIGSGLYSERSHCHVILTSYETLLLDIHFFKDVLWFSAVFDQPWGFFSNNKYCAAFEQIAEVLRARHKIFSCDKLTLAAEEGNAEPDLLPDLFSAVQAICPFFLGFSNFEDPLKSNFKSLAENRGLLLLNGLESVEIDQKGLFYLLGVVAAHTTVFDGDLFQVMEEHAQAQGASVFPVNDLLNLLALFLWNNAEIRIIPHDQLIENDDLTRNFVFNKESPYVPTNLKSALDGMNADLVMVSRRASHTDKFVDSELEAELKQVNLAVVGKTGAGIQRLFIENPLDQQSEEQPLRDFHRRGGGGRGRGGRGRGRGSC